MDVGSVIKYLAVFAHLSSVLFMFTVFILHQVNVDASQTLNHTCTLAMPSAFLSMSVRIVIVFHMVDTGARLVHSLPQAQSNSSLFSGSPSIWFRFLSRRVTLSVRHLQHGNTSHDKRQLESPSKFAESAIVEAVVFPKWLI